MPEQWNVREIVKIASLFAVGWLILAFVILWVVLDLLKLPVRQVQTLMFAYLIYTAQATIYMTRVRDRFGRWHPAATSQPPRLATSSSHPCLPSAAF